MSAAIVELVGAHAVDVELIAASMVAATLILSEKLRKGSVRFNDFLLLGKHNADCGRMCDSCFGCADGHTGLSLLIFSSVFRLFLLKGLEEIMSKDLSVIRGRPGTSLKGGSVSHDLD